MTTLMMTDGGFAEETHVQAVARRLRSELAAIGVKPTQAARILGMSQPWMSRRVNGQTALSIQEIETICATFELSYVYLVSGIRPIDPSGGGAPIRRLPLPRMDSNHQPCDSAHESSLEASSHRKQANAA